MKRKLIIATGMLTLAMVTPSFAWDSSYSNSKQKQGYDSPYGNSEQQQGYKSSYGNREQQDHEGSYGNNEQKQGYESSFGNNYQYDLNNPSDRVKYGVDPAAQLRDSIDVNPTRELESNIGEHGGGVYGR